MPNGLRKLQERLRPWTGDTAFGLFVAVATGAIYGSLASAGVITMTLAILLLVVAWLAVVAATFFVTHLYAFTMRSRIVTAAASAVLITLVGGFEFENQPAAVEQSFLKVGLSCRHFGGSIPQLEDGRPPHVVTIVEEIPTPVGFTATQDEVDNHTRFYVRSGFIEANEPNSIVQLQNFRNTVKCEFSNYTKDVIPNSGAIFLLRMSRVSSTSINVLSEIWMFASMPQKVPLNTIGTSIHAIASVYFVGESRDVFIITKPTEVGSCDIATHKMKVIQVLQDQSNPDIYLFPADAQFATVPALIRPYPALPQFPERTLPRTCP